MSGWWDFSFHILKPELLTILGEPFEKQHSKLGMVLRDCSCLLVTTLIIVLELMSLQHLPTIGVLQTYLAEIYRVMKPRTMAILYMGFLPDKFRKCYIDHSAQTVNTIRQVTLCLTFPQAASLLSDYGFQIIDVRRSQKMPWQVEWEGQFYAIIKKDDPEVS